MSRQGEAAAGSGSEEPEVDLTRVVNAPFVNKLWRMVNDPKNEKYIRWMPGGKAIQIVDREGFEKTLLPEHFKHKRFTSFVRQLNMYGWHKVQDLSAGTMNSNEEHWQFASPYFIQGHPELLPNIVRNRGHKSGTHKIGNEESEAKDDNPNLKAILKELEMIRNKQINIGEDLGRMRKDNELLWSEYYQTRERYDKHSQMLSRILRFLATVYGNQNKLLDLSNQDRFIEAPNEHQQQYMQLLPANVMQSFPGQAQPPQQPPRGRVSPATFSDSGASDLREIEQMHNQIQEAGPAATPNSGASSTPSSTPGLEHMPSPSISTPDNGALTPSKALVPSRRVSQALVPQSVRRQSLRAPPHVQAPQPPPGVRDTARSGSIHPLSSDPQPNFGTNVNGVNGVNTNLDEDPTRLFPDLSDFTSAGIDPPVTSQADLEQISKDLAQNGMSLQSIQDWLSKQPLGEYGSGDDSSLTDSDNQFNVNDFLTDDPQSSVSTAPALEADDPLTTLEDGAPSRKRAKAA